MLKGGEFDENSPFPADKSLLFRSDLSLTPGMNYHDSPL